MVNYLKRIWQAYRKPNMPCVITSLILGLISICAGFDPDYSAHIPSWYSFTVGILGLIAATFEYLVLRIGRKRGWLP